MPEEIEILWVRFLRCHFMDADLSGSQESV